MQQEGLGIIHRIKVSLNWMNTHYFVSCNKTWELATVEAQDHQVIMYSIKQNPASLNIERNVWEETDIINVWNLIVSYNQSEDTGK